jgi:hypothetical protein
MRWARFAAVAAFACLPVGQPSAAPAYIFFKHGVELYIDCEGDSATKPNSRCETYVTAVSDAHIITQFQMKQTPYFCLPENTDAAKLTMIVRKYLADHQDRSGHAAAALVIEALSDTYPCPPPPQP